MSRGSLPLSPEERATLVAHLPDCACDYSRWVAALLAENERLRAALDAIANWAVDEPESQGVARRALGPASPQP